jgi:hypothetical protein
MVNKLTTGFVDSPRTIIIVLFSGALACGASQACAVDKNANSSPRQVRILDTSGEAAELWMCYSYRNGTQTCINTHRAEFAFGHTPENAWSPAFSGRHRRAKEHDF